ncbi:MAG: hypothetical protein FWE38_03750 [Firmicutes bacterium]|nr:hypothetical protein [Bacillota bacterium]
MNELDQYTEDLHEFSQAMARIEKIADSLGITLKSLCVDFTSARFMVDYLYGYIDCMLANNLRPPREQQLYVAEDQRK